MDEGLTILSDGKRKEMPIPSGGLFQAGMLTRVMLDGLRVSGPMTSGMVVDSGRMRLTEVRDKSQKNYWRHLCSAVSFPVFD